MGCLEFRRVIKSHPVIAAVRQPADLAAALAGVPPAVFLLGGSLTDLPSITEQVHKAGKVLAVHIDLLEGLAKDQHGLRYLAELAPIDGIVSTRTHLVQAAKHVGLGAVLRIFILDSQSVHTGSEMARDLRPDVVEMLPGLLPGVIRQISGQMPFPVIAGGLVRTRKQLARAVAAGAVAVSTSAQELWQLTAAEIRADLEALIAGAAAPKP